MATKAALKIVLYADDLVVAEIEDARLWQQVLSAATSSEPVRDSNTSLGSPRGESLQEEPGTAEVAADASTIQATTTTMATELGVREETIDGALSPHGEPPYLSINHNVWEAFKKNTPKRGANAVAAVVASATLAALWGRAKGEKDIALDDAKSILNELGAEYFNPTRSLQNCEWLILKNGRIRINPARSSVAVSFAKAFVEQSSWSRPE